MTRRESRQFEGAVAILIAALAAWIVTVRALDQAPGTMEGLIWAMLAPLYALIHNAALPIAVVAGLWCLWLTRRSWRR